jgi:hypothetical protein
MSLFGGSFGKLRQALRLRLSQETAPKSAQDDSLFLMRTLETDTSEFAVYAWRRRPETGISHLRLCEVA